MATSKVSGERMPSQYQKPQGWVGRLLLWNMNSRHSGVTDWGLSHVHIEPHFTILDVGCGGGRTVSKLANAAPQGKVYGVDHSETSVAATAKTNARWIRMQRVEVRHGSVSELPFEDGKFDLVTAVETHFWWPDIPAGIREIHRVLKPGGTLAVIGEVYKGATTRLAKVLEKNSARVGLKLLDPEEHRALLTGAGFSDVQSFEEHSKGWITVLGKRPVAI